VHAALVKYPRYLDPETGMRCEAESLLAWMTLQRRQRARLPERVRAHGFSPAKKPALRRFTAGSELLSRWSPSAELESAGHLHWGPAVRRSSRTGNDAGHWCVEDGFLRSVGLGAELVQPLSWVFDDVGIYYDATRPSRLEKLLQETAFDDALLVRAAALRAAIVVSGITKYNLGGSAWQRPATAGPVILVPGQVESDASIQWGAPAVKTNLGLLRAVRAARPDAWLVYKPHPDVLSGVRKPGRDEHHAAAVCDEVVTTAPVHALIAAVDEVHVLTSLAGFEALLRDKPVTCWGQPFYAGWGLTRDCVPVVRRTRRLALDELVAATLILYPDYVSRRSGVYTTPERALAELRAWRDEAPEGGWRRGLARHFMRWRARWL
jgi:capsular polysaccharide export protein